MLVSVPACVCVRACCVCVRMRVDALMRQCYVAGAQVFRILLYASTRQLSAYLYAYAVFAWLRWCDIYLFYVLGVFVYQLGLLIRWVPQWVKLMTSSLSYQFVDSWQPLSLTHLTHSQKLFILAFLYSGTHFRMYSYYINFYCDKLRGSLALCY